MSDGFWNEDQATKCVSENGRNSPRQEIIGNSATVQRSVETIPIISDEIASVPVKINNGHFWPYYRKLKFRPPLYDCHDHLIEQSRPHGTTDEEDPSLNAKFDPSRFIYPVQKNVQQAPRNPNVSNTLRLPKQPTAISSASSVAVVTRPTGSVKAEEQKVSGMYR